MVSVLFGDPESIALCFEFLGECYFKYDRVSPSLSQILFNCSCIDTSKNIFSSPKINIFFWKKPKQFDSLLAKDEFLSLREFRNNFAKLDCKFQSSFVPLSRRTFMGPSYRQNS